MVAVGPDTPAHRVEGLEPVAGVEDDRLRVGVELAGCQQLAERRHGHPAGRLGEDALGAGQQPDALDDLRRR